MQSFFEKLNSEIDRKFEACANAQLDAVRSFEPNRSLYVTGKMDGLHAASEAIAEVYKMFVNEIDSPRKEEETSLYGV